MSLKSLLKRAVTAAKNNPEIALAVVGAVAPKLAVKAAKIAPKVVPIVKAVVKEVKKPKPSAT